MFCWYYFTCNVSCAVVAELLLVLLSMSHALSCLTLHPPHPSWENKASRTDCKDSKCFEVVFWDAPDSVCPGPELEDVSLFGNPFPAAAAHEGGGALFWVIGPPGACDGLAELRPDGIPPGFLMMLTLAPFESSKFNSNNIHHSFIFLELMCQINIILNSIRF